MSTNEPNPNPYAPKPEGTPGQPPQAPGYPAAPQYGTPPQAPGYPAAPQYGAPQYSAPAKTPGKTLGIVGFVLAFFLPLIGMILSIVALVQSKKAGQKNGLALAGIIIGAVFTVLIVVFSILVFGVFSDVIDACLNNPNGTYTLDGVEYSCQGS